MHDGNLFQLGIGLETGAHAEDSVTARIAGKTQVTAASLLDETRHDHFIGLDDEARIAQAFRDCVETCGATLLHIHTHKFSPQGVSGVAVLAESHISVHTWPEIGYGAFDVFMCGDAQPWRAVGVLKAAFVTDDVRVTELLRGDGLVEARA